MEDKIILTFDVGTQSSRAVLVNDHGELIAKKQIQHEPPYISPEKGFAEKKPEEFYDVLCKAASKLKVEYPQAFSEIQAVTITTIRDSFVNVDKDGKPLRNAILWIDSRQADGLPKLPATSSALFSVIGFKNFINLQYKKSYCNWIMEHEPEIWEKTDKFMLLSAYLTYCLTGNMTDAVASTVGHIPFDVKKRDWADKNSLTHPIFNVPKEKLVKLTESCEIMGYITEQAEKDTGIKAGTPVFASGADKACEIIGMGCVKKTQAAVSFGTMSSISYNDPVYLEAQQFLPPYPSVIKGWYNPEYELYRGYWLVSWFKNEFCQQEAIQAAMNGKSVEEVMNASIEEIEPGCNGLFLSPYFSPDMMQPFARGGFIGLADYHTKKHMYKAVLEGINFSLMEGLRYIEQKGKFKFTELRVGGGGAQSREICQMTADMFGIPVYRTSTHETSALGSAVATFIGLGVYKDFDEACQNMVHEKDVFQPNLEKTAIYNKLFEVYKKIYPALKPLYGEIADIYKK